MALPVAAIVCIALAAWAIIILAIWAVYMLLKSRGVCQCECAPCGKEDSPRCSECCVSMAESCNCCNPSVKGCLNSICPSNKKIDCVDVLLCQCCASEGEESSCVKCSRELQDVQWPGILWKTVCPCECEAEEDASCCRHLNCVFCEFTCQVCQNKGETQVIVDQNTVILPKSIEQQGPQVIQALMAAGLNVGLSTTTFDEQGHPSGTKIDRVGPRGVVHGRPKVGRDSRNISNINLGEWLSSHNLFTNQSHTSMQPQSALNLSRSIQSGMSLQQSLTGLQRPGEISMHGLHGTSGEISTHSISGFRGSRTGTSVESIPPGPQGLSSQVQMNRRRSLEGDVNFMLLSNLLGDIQPGMSAEEIMRFGNENPDLDTIEEGQVEENDTPPSRHRSRRLPPLPRPP